MSQEFENCAIDEEVVDQDKEYPFINCIVDHEIIQLKNYCITKGLVPLEKLFDINGVAKSPGLKPSDEDVEDGNIGKEQEPKLVKISKKFPVVVKKKYVDLLKKNLDVLA